MQPARYVFGSDPFAVPQSVLVEAQREGFCLYDGRDEYEGSYVNIPGHLAVFEIAGEPRRKRLLGIRGTSADGDVIASMLKARKRQEDAVVARRDVLFPSQIADRLGVQPDTVRKWRQRYPNFPDPLAREGDGGAAVWDFSEVEEWNSKRARSVPA